ncbi:hemerythrin domain-containing protein [Streptomyces sp. BI20]|uniref:hemerythrin domain-containing protein n=1 Tax=Streptomyces sp. BI20 TaxID=3403460 RepID=UPI003C75133E
MILDDHRRMEELLHRMRSVESDRADALTRFSALLVAHGEAEELEVYPALRRLRNVDAEEVDHGAEEHEEGNEALLALLEVEEVGSEDWEKRLHELSEKIAHHFDEEERTILNDARENVSEERRGELGERFLRARRELLMADCGAVEKVRDLVRVRSGF